MMATPTEIDPAEHLGLVWSLARRFRGRGMDLDDLVGEGSVALVEAARRFDPARNLRFSTYATTYIRGYLKTALERRAPLIHVPRQARQMIRRGLSPESPGLNPVQRDCLESGLVASKRWAGSDTLACLVNPCGARSEGYLDDLPDLHATVLRLRYGADGRDPRSQRAVGRMLDLSDYDVRRIEAAAIARLGRVAGIEAEETAAARRTAQAAPCACCGTTAGYVPIGKTTPKRRRGARYGFAGMLCHKCEMRLRARQKAGRTMRRLAPVGADAGQGVAP